MKKTIFSRVKCAVVVLCTLLVATFYPVTDTGVPSQAEIVARAAEDDPSAISLNTTSAKIIIDNTYTLRVYNTKSDQTIVCKSGDSKIVSVKASEKSSSAFILKGKKCGTTEVTIRIREGLSTVETLKCEVQVGLPAISVAFTRAKIKLSVGGRTSLKTILKPSDTVEDPTYVSSDKSIAYVSQKGTVIAKAAGECTITAYIKKKDDNNEYICDSCKIIITEDDLSSDDSSEN